MLEFIKINYKSVLSLVILETRTRSPNKKFYHKVNIIVHITLRILFFFFGKACSTSSLKKHRNEIIKIKVITSKLQH